MLYAFETNCGISVGNRCGFNAYDWKNVTQFNIIICYYYEKALVEAVLHSIKAPDGPFNKFKFW